MAVPLDVLQSLASTFSAVRDGPQLVAPGQPVSVKLVPSSAADLHATDLVGAPFDLTWITKDVRFNTATTEPAIGVDPFDPSTIDALLAGGMPARVPVLGGVGFQDLAGTPGEIAQLAGTLPVAVEVPVGLAVTWQVLDSDGVTVLTEGPGTFTAPGGTTAPSVGVVFAAATVELTASDPVPVARRFIRATVTLTAGTTSHTFTLPDIPVDVPAIPVPSVIVFFLHTHFAARHGDDDGAAFIVVPNNSPLKTAAQLQDTLNTLESTLSSLTSVAEFAAFLLGVSELASALSAQPHVQFRVADSANHFNNFNDVTLKKHWAGFLFGWSNTEAEDELSSLIYIAAPRRQVSCFRDRNRRGRNFTLATGPALHVMIRSLHSASPAIEPGPALGGSIGLSSGSSSFGDELSSLSFS